MFISTTKSAESAKLAESAKSAKLAESGKSAKSQKFSGTTYILDIVLKLKMFDPETLESQTTMCNVR